MENIRLDFRMIINLCKNSKLHTLYLKIPSTPKRLCLNAGSGFLPDPAGMNGNKRQGKVEKKKK